MDGSLESGCQCRGVWGFYRFTNPEWEKHYQARLRRWCFWMAIFHLYFDLALDIVALVGWVYVRAFPVAFWVTASVDFVGLLFLISLHTSSRCRRYVIPLHCAFILLVYLRNAALIPLQAVQWTGDSYSYLIPASSTVYVESPTSERHDISGLLRSHLASLAAYRSLQIAYANSYGPGVYNMLMGFNPWTLGTAVGMNVLLGAGIATTPATPAATLVLSPCAVGALTVLSMLFAAAFERMQRRNFGAERLLQWELQASQMADSVLNHSLKNTLADVAGNIEMFLAGALSSKALEDCIVSLRRGIRSCKERQGYLQIVAGQYQPVLNAIPLQDFGRQLLAGRDVAGRFADCTVYADHMLLTLILDNALSNAGKHGHPQTPNVTFTIDAVPTPGCPDVPLGKRRICFQVTNVAHPRRPVLTPEYVEQLFAGCAQRRHDSVVPTLSDRIGLSHCVLAARLGGVALSLTQEDDIVTFRAVLDAELAPTIHRLGSQEDDCVAPRPPPFPPGLRFVILDDSLSAQKLLKFHIEKLCTPAAVICLGATSDDVDAFMAAALGADVVIVDQHLDWVDSCCLGTDLVRQLRTVLFGGFICIRSANDGPQDQALYLRAGANCSVGKDLLGPVMVKQLRGAYTQFLDARTRPDTAATTTSTATTATRHLRRHSGVTLSGVSCRVSVTDAASSSRRGSMECLSPMFSIHEMRLTSMDALLANITSDDPL
eukprot:EG_transcript_4203